MSCPGNLEVTIAQWERGVTSQHSRKMSSSSFFECANWAFHKVFQFCQSRIPFLCRWRRERIFGDLFHLPTWTVFLLQRLYSHCLQQVFSNQSQRAQHHWSRGKGTRKSQKIYSRKSNTKIIWLIEYSLLRVLVMIFFQASKDKDKLRKFLDEGDEITKTMLNHHDVLDKTSGEIEEAAAKTTMQIENRIEDLTKQVTTNWSFL